MKNRPEQQASIYAQDLLMKERQGILQKIDPFRDNEESKKAFTRGLKNFYSLMADPTIDFLERASIGMSRLSTKQIENLKRAGQEAESNSIEYFTVQGIEITDPEKLQTGINNSIGFINQYADEFSHYSESPLKTDDSKIRTFAQKIHEQIQIENGEAYIKKSAQLIRNESDLRKRSLKGQALKEQILRYLSTFPFKFTRGYSFECVEPTWRTLVGTTGLWTELETIGGSVAFGSFELKNAVDNAQAAISRHPLEQKLELMPGLDRTRYEKLRLEYGAKGANLTLLSERVPDINSLFNHTLKIAVPDFKLVSVDAYRSWEKHELSDEQIAPYFEWANSLIDDDKSRPDKPVRSDYIIRSSAVYSEDGANSTGAGIYDSIRVPAGSSLNEFREAISHVYSSVQSPRAVEYREQLGIISEEMGLVIQKYISPPDFSIHKQSRVGYINSRIAGVPELMEVVTQTSRNFINKKELDFMLAMEFHIENSVFNPIHHYTPDIRKIDPSLPIKVAQLTSVIERIWGNNVQAEFVNSGREINFVQVRELPVNIINNANEIRFPDETPVHTGSSIGVGDFELDVLSTHRNNSQNTGAVVIDCNDQWTVGNNTPRLPKKGAVIIAYEGGRNGHIQTLAAEKGLICIFPDSLDEVKPTLTYPELLDLERVRIVSNGLEGRIYKIPTQTGKDRQ